MTQLLDITICSHLQLSPLTHMGSPEIPLSSPMKPTVERFGGIRPPSLGDSTPPIFLNHDGQLMTPVAMGKANGVIVHPSSITPAGCC